MLLTRLVLFFTVFFFFFSSYLHASLISDKVIAAAAQDEQWLNLLHFTRSGGGFADDAASFVDDKNFFLSDSGRYDAAAELAATIQAFKQRPQSQCDFPARKLWLDKKIPELVSQISVAHCASYLEWRNNIAAHEVVLVFASSYINSPSSMYGHTFLRVDAKGLSYGEPLLSYALSFGADIPEQDGGLLYAFKGLFGGYPGTFDGKPYYEKVKEYSRLESRDLWEYHLDLTPQELDLFMAHVWELDFIKFDYFFFDENCALRLMELLDIARPGLNLTDKFPDVAIPIDTVRVVTEAGIVSRVVYRPSNQSKLKAALSELTEFERALVLPLSQDEKFLQSPVFAGLSLSRQKLVAHTAYSYLRYETNTLPRTDDISRRNLALLRFINQAEKKVALPIVQKPTPPELGHKTKMWALVLGEEQGQVFADFEFHMSYHDLLDNHNGYPKNASLNMGRFILRNKEGATRLQRLDLVEIASLNPRDDFFQPISWRVLAGWERHWVNGREELASQINGGAGLTVPLVAGIDGYVLATGRLEYNEGFEDNWDVAPGVATGLLWGNGKHQALLALDHYRFIQGVDRNKVSIGYNFSMDANNALRLMFNRSVNDSQGVTEASVSFRHYF